MITAISIVVVMIGAFGLLGWWFVVQSKPPKYNGILWKLPFDSGQVETINRKPEGQKPFYFNYRWFDLFPRRRPLYMWAEYQEGDKVGIRHWEPKESVDHKIWASVKGEDGESKSSRFRDYITTNELYDCTDWSCAKRFETIRSKLTEAVKLGAALIMVIVCVVGMIMVFDMVNKPKVENTAQPPTHTQMIEVNK